MLITPIETVVMKTNKNGPTGAIRSDFFNPVFSFLIGNDNFIVLVFSVLFFSLFPF